MRIQAVESISYYEERAGQAPLPHWLQAGDRADVPDALGRKLVGAGRAKAVAPAVRKRRGELAVLPGAPEKAVTR